jgi:hypothetical protein
MVERAGSVEEHGGEERIQSQLSCETKTPIPTWPTNGGDDDAGVSEAGIEIRVQSNRMPLSQE